MLQRVIRNQNKYWDNNPSHPLNSFSYRIPITLNSAQVSGNHTDQMFWKDETGISAGDKTHLFANAKTDASDVIFATQDGTTIYSRNIARWNVTGEKFLAFIETASLTSAADIECYIYYGNASYTATQHTAWPAEFISICAMDGTEVTARARGLYQPGADQHYQSYPAEEYNGKTYIAMLEPVPTSTANIWVLSFNTATGAFIAANKVVSVMTYDNHRPPDLAVIQSGVHLGKICIAYSTGPSGKTVVFKRSPNAEDVTGAWTTVTVHTSAGSNEPNKAMLRSCADGTLLVGFQEYISADTTWHQYQFYRSTDGGGTFGSMTQLINMPATDFAVYAILHVEGNVVHLFAERMITRATLRTQIYYMRSDDSGATWEKIDSTAITLPADNTDMDLVYDANANSKGARVHDARVNGSGNPCCLIVESDGVGGDGTVRYVHWNGSAWITPENIAGNPVLSTNYKHAGASFDSTDTDFVYLVNEDATYNILERYERVGADDWNLVETVRRVYKNGKGEFIHPRPVKRGTSAAMKGLIIETADHTGETSQIQWGISGLYAYPENSDWLNGRLAGGAFVKLTSNAVIGTGYTSDMNVTTPVITISGFKRNTISAQEDLVGRRDNANPTHPGYIMQMNSTGTIRIVGFTTTTANSVDKSTTAEHDDNVSKMVEGIFNTSVAGSVIRINGVDAAVTNSSAGTYTGVTNNVTTPYQIGARWKSMANSFQGSMRFVMLTGSVPSSNLSLTRASNENQATFFTVGSLQIR